jgi:transposase-like protein
MKTTLKKIRSRRLYSEEFKKSLVKEYEKGTYSVLELEKLYGIPNKSIYNWIYKYSTFNKKSVKIVEMSDSKTQKIKDLEAKIMELEQAVGRKQIKIDYLEKMMDIAKEELGYDVKKNCSTPQSTGSEKKKKK